MTWMGIWPYVASFLERRSNHLTTPDLKTISALIGSLITFKAFFPSLRREGSRLLLKKLHVKKHPCQGCCEPKAYVSPQSNFLFPLLCSRSSNETWKVRAVQSFSMTYFSFGCWYSLKKFPWSPCFSCALSHKGILRWRWVLDCSPAIFFVHVKNGMRCTNTTFEISSTIAGKYQVEKGQEGKRFTSLSL